MADSEAPLDTWLSLLSSLRESLPSVADATIPDEAGFHQKFLDLCVEVQEPDPQRLLSSFLIPHTRVIAFTRDLDELIGFTESLAGLKSLFWSVAFATVALSLRRDCKDDLFKTRLKKLNKEFPVFGPNLELFPNHQSIQTPLQTVFREYISCYVKMLSQLASYTAPISFESFDHGVKSAHEVFSKSKEDWDEKVKLTKEAEQERQQRYSSTASFPNGSIGPLHPYAPRRLSFDWIGSLGGGAHGQVSKVRERNTGIIYAQKTFSLPNSVNRNMYVEVVQNEVKIMEKLSHHHIAKLIFSSYEEDTFSILMLPVADRHLGCFLQELCIDAGFPRSSLVYLTNWFGCLVNALAYAHANQIKHEDIKPTNILIKNNQPYLADFGCAKDFSELESSSSPDSVQVGTPVYWSPEQTKGRAADVFALGCVFSEMLTVRQRRTLNEYRQFRRVENRDNPYGFRKNLPGVREWIRGLESPKDPVSELLVEQILQMLNDDPDQRPPMRKIKKNLVSEGEAVFCDICF